MQQKKKCQITFDKQIIDGLLRVGVWTIENQNTRKKVTICIKLKRNKRKFLWDCLMWNTNERKEKGKERDCIEVGRKPSIKKDMIKVWKDLWKGI